MKKIVVLLFAGMVLTAFNQKKTSESLSEAINEVIKDSLTNALQKIYKQGHINGFSVAIVDENGTLYEDGFGYADIQNNKEYTEHSLQNIASVSKTFIGIALLKAQELGKLDLDDPVNQYLPFEVTNPHFPNTPITLRQLATHTSSITDATAYDKYGYVLKENSNEGTQVNKNFRSPDEMMPLGTFLKNVLNKEGVWYKKKNFLKNLPGKKFEYSNVGAGLAAFIIEKATNEPFKAFTRKYILEPLAMSDTGWSFSEVDLSKHSKLYANKEKELAFYQLVNYPDGNIITSSSDLAKYLSELIRGYNGKGTILSKERYQELFSAQLTAENFEERSENTYNDEYNMGIFMGFSAQGQVGHTGGDPGVATFMFFNSETSLGKLLIINTDLVDQNGVNQFFEIWKTLETYETKL